MSVPRLQDWIIACEGNFIEMGKPMVKKLGFIPTGKSYSSLNGEQCKKEGLDFKR